MSRDSSWSPGPEVRSRGTSHRAVSCRTFHCPSLCHPGTEPYRWCSYTTPLASGASDLTSLTGIRFWAHADPARTLLVTLDTTQATETNAYYRYGWFVPLTDQPTQVEVPFDDLVSPWGTDPGYTAADARATATGLAFEPQVSGRQADRYLPHSTTDPGSVYVDDIEFF